MKEINHLTDEATIREDVTKALGIMIETANELIFDAYDILRDSNGEKNRHYYKALGKVEGALRMIEIITGRYGEIRYNENGVYFIEEVRK